MYVVLQGTHNTGKMQGKHREFKHLEKYSGNTGHVYAFGPNLCY